MVEAGPPDELRAAEVEHLRGQIALDERRDSDAAQLLLDAAKRFEPVNAALARETHLESLVAAIWAGELGIPGGARQAAEAALAAPPGPDPPRVVDVVLDAFALRVTQGYAAAAPVLTRALQLLLALDAGSGEGDRWVWLAGGRASGVIGMELWDFESWHALLARQLQVARDTGALGHMRLALTLLILNQIIGGELSTAARLIQEDRLIAEATGTSPIGQTAMILAAWRGREREATELIEAAVRAATARGLGMQVDRIAHSISVLYNGLGRHDAARDAARPAFEHDHLSLGPLVVPELAEAASRTGDVTLVRATLEWVSERTRVTPTEWLLGIEARILALLSEGDAADGCYRKSIGHLGRTPVRSELARTHLLYGEWLRREHRRVDAREQLRTAHEMLDAMGMEAFAERARRELLATGEAVRKRMVETTVELTAQEAQVARLARDGLSNPEIGARLFISSRTVQYHLGKVFSKLGISSRGQLNRALPR